MGATLDEQMASLGEAAPGFGGAFFRDDGFLVLATTNPTQAQPTSGGMRLWARQHGHRQVEEALSDGRIELRSVEFTFKQLFDWRRALASGTLEGVIWYDIDERQNRLVVGVVDDAVGGAVREQAIAAGVAPNAIIIVSGGSVEAQQDLNDVIRPVRGGLRIAPDTKSTCTLGVTAVSSEVGAAGFFTANHCSATRAQGGDGSYIWQNYPISIRLIGVEEVDPLPYSCAYPWSCRLSEASWFRYINLGLTSWTPGVIARTTGFGSTTIDSWKPNFFIEDGFAMVGSTVNLIGRASGWIQGTVLQQCVDFPNFNGGGITLTCQTTTTYQSKAGDSGGPVFTWNPFGDETRAGLVGLHWARFRPDAQAPWQGIYSDWNLVAMEFWELGQISVNY